MKTWSKFSKKFVSQNLGRWARSVEDVNLLNVLKARSLVVGLCFCFIFVLISLRLLDVMLLRTMPVSSLGKAEEGIAGLFLKRSDILDRNGEVLATQLITASVFANPKMIIDPKEAAQKLAALLPDQSYETLYKKLSSGKGFVWIARHIPPKLQYEINYQGIPGIFLQKDSKRVYPYGDLVSHVLGNCDIDNKGLAGIEKYFDSKLEGSPEPLRLSIDVRLHYAITQEILAAMERYNADGGNAMVMDIQTGELLAMVSVPTYDPNNLGKVKIEHTFNRNTLGVYEPGSTFKIVTTAIALNEKIATIASVFDATNPIKIGRFTVKDFKGKQRPLTVSEIFVYSSNIGAAKMALTFGSKVQQMYLKLLGFFDTPKLEIPELGSPLYPKTWSEATTITAAYGYGVAVTPLQSLIGISTIVNDGIKPDATLLKREGFYKNNNESIIDPKVSKHIRDLMRLLVTKTIVKGVNAPGLEIFGKTGTAHKNNRKFYSDTDRFTFFIGGFPHSSPRYMVYVMLDDPKPIKETHGYATAGWNAAPTASSIISRIAPILGVVAKEDIDPSTLTPAVYIR